MIKLFYWTEEKKNIFIKRAFVYETAVSGSLVLYIFFSFVALCHQQG